MIMGGIRQGDGWMTGGWRTEASAGGTPKTHRRENLMLWKIAVILAFLWLFGLLSSYTMGGFIHLLLVVALVMVLLSVIQGRRVT